MPSLQPVARQELHRRASVFPPEHRIHIESVVVTLRNVKPQLSLRKLVLDQINESLSLAKIDHRIVVTMDHPSDSESAKPPTYQGSRAFNLHSLRQSRASLQPLQWQMLKLKLHATMLQHLLPKQTVLGQSDKERRKLKSAFARHRLSLLLNPRQRILPGSHLIQREAKHSGSALHRSFSPHLISKIDCRVCQSQR